ncbi:MAG TPA: UDP-N-acetylmuramoylalanyl-D-glutamyl-2,6-diaminopimelate--D-alanyl-D-alanine ligase [Rhodospirillaceae bacterium]|nr:UDP-N-acetylmuramoylalanyl-D-glutamyl-2,6-diaminopimelate--D-alanyl-D-alanine ligase [Rhodospirillaceae bacterium]
MTAPLWTSDAALAATGGRLTGGVWQAGGVSIDSRTLAAGDLFVAIPGPTHDGHDFVAAAFARGAAAALVQRLPPDLPADAPLLVVDDAMAGLTALAVAARTRSAARIVAITGSVGKTGTKEMLRLALSAEGSTHATQGNLNNHWGVPLSLARMPAETAFAVFELGMNHPGEIAPLSRLVRPHLAVITSVEAVHMEFFGSTLEIADAKAEIFEGVEPGGGAVLPRDNPHFAFLANRAAAAGIGRIEGFGSHIDAEARLLDCAVDPEATLIFALFDRQAISYRLGVAGRQWALNSLAALLAATGAGAQLETAAAALAAMTAPKGRGQRKRLAWGDGWIEVIDESYNASPVSMKAAIATLGAARPTSGGRRIAVLGDMLELGHAAPVLHGGLAAAAVDWSIDRVFTAGPLMRHLHDALPADRRGGHAGDAGEAAAMVRDAVRAGDVVMIKGSAGSRMGQVVSSLEQAAMPPKPAINGN